MYTIKMNLENIETKTYIDFIVEFNAKKSQISGWWSYMNPKVKTSTFKGLERKLDRKIFFY